MRPIVPFFLDHPLHRIEQEDYLYHFVAWRAEFAVRHTVFRSRSPYTRAGFALRAFLP